ncbi:acyl-CoA N-acyltransferase [Pyrenochaeta sp. MPI-SDFR-AT-0127]|nr:acyl-CoA N-acyltransferase [Pyrenochaeta sp. MPI-SDFR-AT-0127]
MAQTSQPEVKIRPAVFPDDKAIVGKLFLAYAQGLPISLDFQNFETELEALPGKYAVEKGGAVYLAYTVLPIASSSSSTANGHAESQQSPSEQIIGCVAIRPFAPPRQCELKRLYLTPESRGLGVSKLLLELAIRQARQLGYKEMLLDTLSSMTAARTLYERYGFEEIGSYYDSVEDAVFYRLVL